MKTIFKKYKYYILLHLIIFMWGFTGILGKLIHLDAIVIVWFRVWIAFLFLGAFMIFTKRSLLINSSKMIIKLIIVGLFVGLHWMSFFKAIQLSTASLGILCLATTTLHVTWLEPIIMKRKFSWTEFFLGLLIILGIYFISSDFNPQQYEALIYGLISALLAALFAVYNAQMAEEISTSIITFYEMLAAFIFISFIFLIQGELNAELFNMTISDLLWLLFLGIACTSIAFLVTIEIVKILGTFTVSLSINLEPVYTMVLAVVILSEHQLLNSRFYIGSFVIVLVVILNAWIKNIQKRKAIKLNKLS
ncbi:MAG: EamA family transporter [Crocinitomicaceae bacterium]|nr:EamA family transporter [Crocinitomicaceae bacterium]